MLAELGREQFEEWWISDQIDGTISGLDRLTWTVAGAAAVTACAQGIDASPADFVPGAPQPEPSGPGGGGWGGGQSPEIQIEICRQIAAIHNSRL
jgi:hypothetical protein